MCFAPVEVRGKVVQLDDTSKGIAKAHVSAADTNGAPLATTVSKDDGTYALTIRSARADDKGTPIGKTLTLRAAAANYQPFPSGLRVALPVDTSGVTKAEKDPAYVLTTPATTLALIALPGAEQGRPSISGTVEVSDGQAGVLVVAETAGVGVSGVADAAGAFTIFNVPPGENVVQAYSRGVNYTSVPVSVVSGTSPVSRSPSRRPRRRR